MLDDLLTYALDAIWVADEDGIVRYMNPAAEALSGYSCAELVGQPLSRLLPPDIAEVHTGYMRSHSKDGPQFDIMGKVREFSIVAKSGEVIPVGLRAFEITPQDGRRCFGAIMQDYRLRVKLRTERDALLARLSKQALSDELTGLPNRRAFFDEAQRVLAAVRRSGDPACLALLDIDHFKRVNDTFGHPGGDVVLRAIAGVCHATLRGEDYLARFGGEEFALLLRGADYAAALRAAERVREQVELTSVLLPDGREVQVTVSLGVAASTPDCTVDSWLNIADKALYEAKHSGRNRVCLASQDHEVQASA